MRCKHRARCINTQRHARLICYACYAHKLYVRVRAELDREFPNATCDHNSLCVCGCVPKRSIAEILPKFTSEHPKYQNFSGGACPLTPLYWPLRAHCIRHWDAYTSSSNTASHWVEGMKIKLLLTIFLHTLDGINNIQSSLTRHTLTLSLLHLCQLAELHVGVHKLMAKQLL